MAEGDDQPEPTLLRSRVTEDEVAEVVSRWTGIPVSKMLEGDRSRLLRMESSLSERVVGQNEAVTVCIKCGQTITRGPFRTEAT